jgi:hypothetical protein
VSRRAAGVTLATSSSISRCAPRACLQPRALLRAGLSRLRDAPFDAGGRAVDAPTCRIVELPASVSPRDDATALSATAPDAPSR